MATSFPTGLDAIQRVGATDLRNAPGKEGHVLHNNVCDAVEALQAKVGVDGSAVSTSIDKRLADVETGGASSAAHAAAAAPHSGHATLNDLQTIRTENVFRSRREMYRTNLISPSTAPGVVQTLGTVTVSGTHPAPRRVDCVATSSGSTARILAAWTATGLDTSKFYEFSATVVALSLATPGAYADEWMASSGIPTSGTQSLKFSTLMPVAGTRYGFRFQPSASSWTLRVGLGCNTAETVAAGDFIRFEDFQLCEVDSLSGTVEDFSYAFYGAAGKSASVTDSIGSCILVCGDSWANDAADFGALLASTHGREVILVATAGNRLDQISTDVAAKIASGTTGLYRPNFHVPRLAVVQGGINDLVADASAITMFTRLRTIVEDQLIARDIVPLVVLPVLPLNSTHYTSGRNSALLDYARRVYAAGYQVIDPADWCVQASGNANTDFMADESGAWIHLSTIGYKLLAKRIDERISILEGWDFFGSASASGDWG
jgi:hypothetical protein